MPGYAINSIPKPYLSDQPTRDWNASAVTRRLEDQARERGKPFLPPEARHPEVSISIDMRRHATSARIVHPSLAFRQFKRPLWYLFSSSLLSTLRRHTHVCPRSTRHLELILDSIKHIDLSTNSVSKEPRCL